MFRFNSLHCEHYKTLRIVEIVLFLGQLTGKATLLYLLTGKATLMYLLTGKTTLLYLLTGNWKGYSAVPAD